MADTRLNFMETNGFFNYPENDFGKYLNVNDGLLHYKVPYEVREKIYSIDDNVWVLVVRKAL